MSSTRTVLRRGLSDLQGDLIRDPDGSVPTCSGQGGVAGITALDTLLSYYPDDYFNDWFFVLPTGPSGAGTYEATRVADFTSSGGVITLEPDASAQIASAQPYELHRYNPATKHLALNAARINAFDALWLPANPETLVVDNLISGWDFETFATGAFSGWSSVGSPTLTQNSSYYAHGSYAANIAGAAGVGIKQNLLAVAGGLASIDRATQKTLHVRGWLRAADASNVRLRVTFDGSTYTNDSYHAGGNDFEGPSVHYIDVSIPSGLTEMTVSVEKSLATDVQADVVVAWIDHINRYTVPSSIYRRPLWVKQQANISEAGLNVDWVPVTKHTMPISGHILRLEGRGLLTAVTTEAGTMEVSDPETELLYAEALDWLVSHEMGGASSESQAQLERDKARWQFTAQRLRERTHLERYYVPQMPDGSWDVIPEGETNYLWLKGR